MPYTFRHSMCNEAYEKWDFADACKSIRAAGYTGIEIAPFTLAPDPVDISPARRRELRQIIVDSGLQFAGLHWLMVSPKGLHVTTPDTALRERSWQHIRNLIDLGADLGDNSVMVFGSPKQRETTGGLTRAEATRNYRDGLAAVAGQASGRGVTLLIEALPSDQCDVMLSLAEAAAMVADIDRPSIRTMFDSHNAVDETEAHAVLLDRYFDLIKHVHVNETDGKHCGQGDYDFKAIFDVLRRRNYQGWVSLEAFDFTPGPERIANESLRYLESEISNLPA